MPFEETIYFASAYDDGGKHFLFNQVHRASSTLAGDTWSATWAPSDVTAASLRKADNTAVPAPGLKDLFDYALVGTALRIGLKPTAVIPDALVTQFLDGGYINFTVTVDVGNSLVLKMQLRGLRSTNYLVDGGTLASNVGQVTHHSTVTGANFSPPDGVASYVYHVADGFNDDATGTVAAAATYQTGVTADATGHLTFPAAGSAPPDPQSRAALLYLRITHTALGKHAVLPLDVHVPTDVVLLFDRSGSMGTINPVTTATKWAAAEAVGNLFSKLYGDLAPKLTLPSAPGGAAASIATKNRIAIARFWWEGGAAQEGLPAFVASTAKPSVTAGAPSGGTPIGVALKAAAAHFPASKWRRRHVVILTDGMDNQGSPSLTLLSEAEFPTPNTATTLDTGVFFHNVSFAITGETPVARLAALNASHLGAYHNSAPDADPLGADGLRDMFLDVLSRILPVERVDAGAGNTWPMEAGVERCIFVATRALGATLKVGTTGQATDDTQAGEGNGLSWAVVDAPKTGTWTVTAPALPAGTKLFAMYDLALRMRCGADTQGVGRPIRLWAEITQDGRPVTGADVRVGSSIPRESLGEVLTEFVRHDGLRKAFQRSGLPADLVSGTVSAQLAHGGGRLPVAHVDSPAIQRQLLDALERARNLKFQYEGQAFVLSETSPGRYEATVGAASTQNENVYNFYFRADGSSADGSAFARDRRLSVALAPTPSVEHSQTALVKVAVTGGVSSYVASVFPRTNVGKPVGPGLAYSYLVFDYVDPKDRERLPALKTLDHLDGTYSTELKVADGDRPPRIALFPGPPTQAQTGAGVPVEPRPGYRQVKVTLSKLQILDDKDICWGNAGELVFDTVVAPNGNPGRAVSTRLPPRGVLHAKSGQAIDVSTVIFEGLVESDARLSITIGGKELDYLLFFKRQEKLARYHRNVPLVGASFGPDDETNDPESLSDWKVWYTVEVE